MNEVSIAIGLLLFIYIGYQSKAIQSTYDQALSVASSQGSKIPHTQVELDGQFMDPSEVHRLINATTKKFDIPGEYGVLQRNHVTINDDQMATFGTNYSKSFT